MRVGTECRFHTAGFAKRSCESGIRLGTSQDSWMVQPSRYACGRPTERGVHGRCVDHQSQAVDAFLGEGDPYAADRRWRIGWLSSRGAGKTIVGLSVLVRLGMRTLILCTNTTALRQGGIMRSLSERPRRKTMYASTPGAERSRARHPQHLPDAHPPKDQGQSVHAFRSV